MKNCMVVPEKLKVTLPYDSVISLLPVYSKELKTETQRDICTSMFLAVLFTMEKRWKQLKCKLTDECKDKNVV